MMKPTLIKLYSANDQFQLILALRDNRQKRQKQRTFFVEGVRSINLALQHGWAIHALLYAREQPLSNWASEVLRNSHAQLHYELSLPLLQQLSNKEEASELLALVTMPADELARIPLRPQPLIVVFDRPASPGNLGTTIRSCDALQVDGLIVTGHAADLYDQETIRATTGSFFALPTVRLPSQQELLPWLAGLRQRYADLQVVGTSAKAEVDVAQHDFRRATVLLLGNETSGLSHAYKELCDALVTIPIGGAATSLNVACAASILLYEANRQRRAVSGF